MGLFVLLFVVFSVMKAATSGYLAARKAFDTSKGCCEEQSKKNKEVQ